MGQYEATAAELQAANTQLAEALQGVQAHAARLEARLEEQGRSAEAAAAAAAAEAAQRSQQLEELAGKLEPLLAGRQALQAQLEAAAAERAQLEAGALEAREAAAASAQRAAAAAAAREQELLGRVAELEARKPLHLTLTVSHEAEWRGEAVRAAALEARSADLAAQVAAFQRRERLEAAW